MKRRYLSAAILALFSPLAFAAAPFVVKDIRVEGVQRTEPGTIFNYLPIKIGDTVDDDKVSQGIKSLYATGFFKDVSIQADGNVLVVTVEERQSIAQISFSGNSEFKSDDLLKGLKDLGIGEARAFDRSLLDRAEQEIKRLYLSKSYYGVTIKTTVSPLERNRVAINFEIKEGDVARIKDVQIIGNTTFKESTLIDLMSLGKSNWMSWWSKNDRYSKARLLGDIEEIKSFYLNRGYADFNIVSSQVSISPERKDVYITLTIQEGAQYKISSVKLAGNLIVPEDQLRQLVKVRPGDTFSREALNDTSKALSDRFGNDGYAFANVNISPEFDKKNKLIDLTFFIDPGRRAYVNRINIVGNTKTRDEVIRRELRQMEGSWFDRESVEKSKQRIDRTGFFEDVNIQSKPVENTTDQVDIDVAVKERPTGSISLGIGYSQTDRVVLSGGLSQSNLFGTGNALSFTASTGTTNKVLSLSYTDPYFTADGISSGFDIYHKSFNPDDSVVAHYKTASDGGGIRFGVPIAEDDTIGFGLTLDRTKTTTYDDSPLRYQQFVADYGQVTTSLLLSANWSRDRRDSVVYPMTGTYQHLSTEVAVPPAEMRYWRAGYQIQHYFALSSEYALMLNADLGLANGYAGKPLPFYKNYYAGGIGSVRGYKDNSLGPKDKDIYGNTTTDALGGSRKIVTTAEFLFPFPGMKEKDRSLRMSIFADGGQVWSSDDKVKLGDLRFSAGIALSWVSPIGPLKFSYGYPLNKKQGDETQSFQFQVGSVF